MPSDRSIGDATVIARADGVLSRQSGDETVLLSMTKEQYFGLNKVGSSVWSLIDPQATFGDIVEQLLEMYDVEREVLVADLHKLVDDLIDGGLVHTDAA